MGLRELGANVFEFPTIRIEPANDSTFNAAAANLARGHFDWVVLTSVNGVDALFAEFAKHQFDARAMKAKVAAVGSATAQRLAENGIRADLLPPEFVAESIVEALKTKGEIAGKSSCWPEPTLRAATFPPR